MSEFLRDHRIERIDLRPIDNAILADVQEEFEKEIRAFLKFEDLVNFIARKLNVIGDSEIISIKKIKIPLTD